MIMSIFKTLIVNENIIVNENVIVATAPSIDTHLTNKLYVDTAIATETESILANDVYRFKYFSK
jgi:hypothetical protein